MHAHEIHTNMLKYEVRYSTNMLKYEASLVDELVKNLPARLET